jgi:TolA-binding protein
MLPPKARGRGGRPRNLVRTSFRAFALLALLTPWFACRRRSPPAPAPIASDVTAPSSVTSAAATTAGAAPVGSSSAAAPAASGATLSPESRAKVNAYRRHLAAGRNASKAGRYDEADAALTSALKALPGDSVALGERGLVRVKKGDASGAGADFERALGSAPDRTVAAQLWFNLGLLEEKQRNDERAQLAFARSYLLRPAEAAKAKLKDARPCAAEIARLPPAPSDRGARLLVASDWMGLYRQYDGALGDAAAQPAPTDESGARQWFCYRTSCEAIDRLPWRVERWANSCFFHEESAIIETTPELLVYVAGAVPGGLVSGGCGGDLTACSGGTDVRAARHGRWVRVTQVETTARKEELTPPAGRADDDPAPYRCHDGYVTTTDRWYDVTTRRELLSVARVRGAGEPADLVTVDGAGPAVRVTGGGCDVTFSLADLARVAAAERP